MREMHLFLNDNCLFSSFGTQAAWNAWPASHPATTSIPKPPSWFSHWTTPTHSTSSRNICWTSSPTQKTQKYFCKCCWSGTFLESLTIKQKKIVMKFSELDFLWLVILRCFSTSKGQLFFIRWVRLSHPTSGPYQTLASVASFFYCQQLTKWMSKFMKNQEMPFFRCGNKVDLKSRIQVTDSDMEAFCEQCHNLVSGVYKTSCKTGQGIEEMFADIAKQLAEANR